MPVGVSNEIEIPASILDVILKETHGKIFQEVLVLFQTREISDEKNSWIASEKKKP